VSSEHQRVKPIQQGKKSEEDCDVYSDNRKEKVRLNKVTEEVRDFCVRGGCVCLGLVFVLGVGVCVRGWCLC
jgi:hypothetical protein